MSDFIVSARKYRPATFASVVGQKHITSTLKNAIERAQLAHAYLFCGPRGVGKTTCARIFAKAINCLSPKGAEACNECESCRSFNEGRSLNIHELDAASNNSVEDIRTLIEQVRIIPQVGRYSVFIIDEVHMLSAAAFNAFLKTLEEPPAHAIFILATTEKHKIIPTILSRCQIYDFNRIRVEDSVEYLRYIAGQERITADEESLNLIAQKADGGMRDALSMFDKAVSFCGATLDYRNVAQTLNVLDYDTYFSVTEMLLGGNYVDVLVTFDAVLSKGFSGQTFTAGLNRHMRDLLMAKRPETLRLIEMTGTLHERYRAQAGACSVEFLFGAISVLTELDGKIRQSSNQRLLVELGLMKIAGLGQKKNDDMTSSGEYPLPALSPRTAAPAGAAAPAVAVQSAPQPAPSAVQAQVAPAAGTTAQTVAGTTAQTAAGPTAQTVAGVTAQNAAGATTQNATRPDAGYTTQASASPISGFSVHGSVPQATQTATAGQTAQTTTPPDADHTTQASASPISGFSVHGSFPQATQTATAGQTAQTTTLPDADHTTQASASPVSGFSVHGSVPQATQTAAGGATAQTTTPPDADHTTQASASPISGFSVHGSVPQATQTAAAGATAQTNTLPDADHTTQASASPVSGFSVHGSVPQATQTAAGVSIPGNASQPATTSTTVQTAGGQVPGIAPQTVAAGQATAGPAAQTAGGQVPGMAPQPETAGHAAQTAGGPVPGMAPQPATAGQATPGPAAQTASGQVPGIAPQPATASTTAQTAATDPSQDSASRPAPVKPTAQAAPAPVRRSLISGASLTELLASAGGDPEEELSDGETPDQAEAVRVDPQCAAKLERARSRILNLIKEKRPRFVPAFELMTFSDNTISVSVPTTELRDEILRSKTGMLMRVAELAGIEGMIELEVVVNEQIRAARPIKLEDRVRHITEKNPLVAELRKALDLEVE